MLGNNFDENEAPNRSGWRRLMIPTIVGIIVIGVAALFVWQFLAHQSSASPTTAHTSTTQTVAPAQTSGQQQPGSSEPIPLTPVYQQAAKEAIAQGFHLTVNQVQQKVQTLPANRGLFGVAQEQGITTDQLHTIIINAQQKASDQMVSTGAWTQNQASANMHYWNFTDMKFITGEIESWFHNS